VGGKRTLIFAAPNQQLQLHKVSGVLACPGIVSGGKRHRLELAFVTKRHSSGQRNDPGRHLHVTGGAVGAVGWWYK
jgi:hypothetical protein